MWQETMTVNGYEFDIAELSGSFTCALVLSPEQILAIGDGMPFVLEWFLTEGREWVMVKNWRDWKYNKQYFTEAQLEAISYSKYATDADKAAARNILDRNTQRTAPKPERAAGGFVYLIESTTGTYKIGRSNNAVTRIAALGVKLPFPIMPIHVIKTENMYRLENELHMRFAAKRINGEWFALSPDDVEYIKSL